MNMTMWFYSNVGPDRGAYIFDNSILEIDFTNRDDLSKINQKHPEPIIGSALRNRKTGEWSGSFMGPRGFDIYVSQESITTLSEFADFLRVKRQEAFEEEKAILADPPKHLERALKEHDWYFHFSDDHSVYMGGTRQWNEIVTIMHKVPVEIAKELFTKYAPSDFKWTDNFA